MSWTALGCNALALAPRCCLMAEGNPKTRARLEAAGCEVLTYRGRAKSRSRAKAARPA